MSKLKKYDVLPVYIVEDHNEVLPYIYRAIGSRYLPLQNVTLIHFDSHPDMLIPTELQADDVFSKHILFDSVSIENWILPAVYAGHISHVIWFKPPWCRQIEDKTVHFYVGRCCKTGRIRTTCNESYFISEVLYVPEHQLECKKLLKFTVITIQPPDWSESTNQNAYTGTSKQDISNQSEELIHPGQGDNKITVHASEVLETSETNSSTPLENLALSDRTAGEKMTADLKENICTGNSSASDTVCDSENLSLENPFGIQAVSQNSDSESSAEQPKVKKQKTDDRQRGRQQNSETRGPIPEGNPDNKSIIHSGDKTEMIDTVSHTHSPENAGVSFCPGKEQVQLCLDRTNRSADTIKCRASLPTTERIQSLCEELKDSHCILDIDLDFFSTKNPFKEMYGPDQYQILQQLYRFQRPDDNSEQNLYRCVIDREKQLKGLKSVFLSLSENPETDIDHPRKEVIENLVSNLKSTTSVAVDYELLHEAGCTCDDTELPHHVSSNTQISQLVDSVQELMSHLYKPTIITVARSSVDDYCPANQVDYIQDKVMEILQDIYLEIDVTMDYSQD